MSRRQQCKTGGVKGGGDAAGAAAAKPASAGKRTVPLFAAAPHNDSSADAVLCRGNRFHCVVLLVLCLVHIM